MMAVTGRAEVYVTGQGQGAVSLPPPMSHKGPVSPLSTFSADLGRDAGMLMDHSTQLLSKEGFPTTALG